MFLVVFSESFESKYPATHLAQDLRWELGLARKEIECHISRHDTKAVLVASSKDLTKEAAFFGAKVGDGLLCPWRNTISDVPVEHCTGRVTSFRGLTLVNAIVGTCHCAGRSRIVHGGSRRAWLPRRSALYAEPSWSARKQEDYRAVMKTYKNTQNLDGCAMMCFADYGVSLHSALGPAVMPMTNGISALIMAFDPCTNPLRQIIATVICDALLVLPIIAGSNLANLCPIDIYSWDKSKQCTSLSSYPLCLFVCACGLSVVTRPSSFYASAPLSKELFNLKLAASPTTFLQPRFVPHPRLSRIFPCLRARLSFLPPRGKLAILPFP
jgi:hypothetical protein